MNDLPFVADYMLSRASIQPAFANGYGADQLTKCRTHESQGADIGGVTVRPLWLIFARHAANMLAAACIRDALKIIARRGAVSRRGPA